MAETLYGRLAHALQEYKDADAEFDALPYNSSSAGRFNAAGTRLGGVAQEAAPHLLAVVEAARRLCMTDSDRNRSRLEGALDPLFEEANDDN